MLRWYLIHSKPLAETVAQLNLERQGYETYLPRLGRAARQGSRRKEHASALFPRYLFLRLNEGHQPLGPVHSSVGVTSVVRFGLSYAVVADEIIRDLQAREGADGLHRLRACAGLTTGAQVRVTMGPFDGLQGVFEREAGADRVMVLLRLLGQDAHVRIAADCIALQDAA
jgi:transcriptional antiterminator RfaH